MTDFEREQYSAYGLPQFIDYFGDKFEGAVTSKVYVKYLVFWRVCCVPSKIAFSRYITKLTDYIIVNKTIDGKKYRIFTKKSR